MSIASLPPARGRLPSGRNVKFGAIFAFRIVYYNRHHRTTARPFWRAARHAPARGQVDMRFPCVSSATTLSSYDGARRCAAIRNASFLHAAAQLKAGPRLKAAAQSA